MELNVLNGIPETYIVQIQTLLYESLHLFLTLLSTRQQLFSYIGRQYNTSRDVTKRVALFRKGIFHQT